MLSPSGERRRNVATESVLWLRPAKRGFRDGSTVDGSKTDYRLIINGRGSANTARLAEICPVDFEIAGPTGKVKSKQINK